MFRRLLTWLGLTNGQTARRQAVEKKAAAFPSISQWELDPYHTQMRFRVMHMGLVEVVGRFRRFSAQVKGSSPAFTDLQVEVQIEVDSIETDMPARDFHLKSPDFFDAANHPYITFRSTGVRWRPLKRFVLEGDLTIKGITHRIQLDGELKGLVLKDLTGQPRVSFALSGQIDRRAWGLTWQAETGDGTIVVDNLVTLDIEAEIATPAGMEAYRQFLAQMGASA
ncbi:MAG: YceI family protein [Bacteroidia bacterium]|nr:YceI family protein [Bacteroidia bacterium]GIV23461.1 MAG: polyisoprenoid-binding protein [Bacteroidia bacterium]